MNYTFLPSLENIVLVKIATTLWNLSDIRALMMKFEFKDSLYQEICKDDLNILKDIEEKIKEKVLLLHKPSSLKEKILCVIKPIGLQIYRWMECNKKSYNLAVKLPDEFSWTPHGTIDRKKTAAALMSDETIDITERYKFACIYCLENYVGALWEKMPEKHRACFYSEDDPRQVAQHQLVVIWTYAIKGEMEKIIRWRTTLHTEMTETCTPELYPFKCALIHCNKVAAEYFWSKLSLEDKEDSLRLMVNYWDIENVKFDGEVFECYDILRFLITRVNKDQQIALLNIYDCDVLLCLLNWPWQSVFMDITNHVVLTNAVYSYLLYKIVMKVTEGYKDYDYQRLFGEFWQKGTEVHKKYVIDSLCAPEFTLLLCLFRNKDKKNISLILKDASVLEKEAMCNSKAIGNFVMLYRTKEFDMLEFFINEFISSHEMMIKFKGKCMKEYPEHDDRLEKFLDDRIKKFNLKRNIEESDCSSAKRLYISSDM